MTRLLPILLALSLCACADHAKETYPSGFIAGERMYFWNPSVAKWIRGDTGPIHHPLSENYVLNTQDGKTWVSAKLARELNRR